MIFIPSRGRRESVQRFFDAYRATRACMPGVLMIDEDDAPTYTGLVYPAGWEVSVEPRTTIVKRFNQEYERHPTHPTYALMFDDLEPKTPDWDLILYQRCRERGIVWPDDEYEHRSTIPWVRADVARAVGFLACPAVKHLFLDTFWGDLADAAKTGGLVEDVKIKHHWDINDRTHNERQDGNDDGNYYTFKKNELPEIARRVAVLWGSA